MDPIQNKIGRSYKRDRASNFNLINVSGEIQSTRSNISHPILREGTLSKPAFVIASIFSVGLTASPRIGL